MSFNSLINGGNYAYPGICLILLAIIKLRILTYSDEAKLQRKEKKTKITIQDKETPQRKYSTSTHNRKYEFLCKPEAN